MTMTDRLPVEILTGIATHLSQHDLCTCLRVCRLWKRALSWTLYNAVDIHSQYQYRLFTRTLRNTEDLPLRRKRHNIVDHPPSWTFRNTEDLPLMRTVRVRNPVHHLYRRSLQETQERLITKAISNTETYHPLGNLIRKIKIPSSLIHHSLIALPTICPYVVEFDIEGKWHPILSPVLQQWKYLAKLPQVILYTGRIDIPLDFFHKRITRLALLINVYREWVDVITKLPCIEELEVECCDSNKNEDSNDTKIALLDLETLHESLPRLRRLAVKHFHLCGIMPEYITPCDTVYDLSLTPKDNHLWGQYFGKKYTFLENLYLNAAEDGNLEAMILAKSCRYLKQVEICTPDGSISSMYRPFLNTLEKIGAPMTLISIHSWDIPWYATIVSGFRTTLSKINICTKEKLKTKDIVGPLQACLSLRELHLQCDGDNILELDCILHYCNRLKTLDINGYNIRVRYICMIDGYHGLSVLRMNGRYIDDDVFAYLSLYCPCLSVLEYD